MLSDDDKKIAQWAQSHPRLWEVCGVALSSARIEANLAALAAAGWPDFDFDVDPTPEQAHVLVLADAACDAILTWFAEDDWLSATSTDPAVTVSELAQAWRYGAHRA
jgi:hypothetical protein